jgi:Predicted phosphosugar isomerases
MAMLRDLVEEELNSSYKVNVNVKLEGGIVTGSGDSFAAALSLEGRSKGKFRALDPEELLNWETNEPIVIISVSGRPKINVQVARKFGSHNRVIAVTSDLDSPLAKEVGEHVYIPYVPKSRLPGTLSFLMSLSAIYGLAGFETKDHCVGRKLDLKGNPFFVGSGENFGIAYFSYLKYAEFLGQWSNFERFEQFCHAPIFTARGRDVVLLDSGPRRKQLADLIKFGKVIDTGYTDPFCNAITIVRSILDHVGEKPYFLLDEEILRTSSIMIYGESS